MSPDLAATVQAFLETSIQREREEAEAAANKQRLRKERLEKEREKLLQAHYADAVPLS
jgi:hypothetical protein